MKDVNANLDYLIVGEKGSTFWKYGSYGTKIEKARQIFHGREGRPKLVPEFEFMLALGECAPKTLGEIHSKVFVANYEFLVKPDGVIDADHLQSWLYGFRESRAVHVQFRTYDFGIYQDLFEAQEKRGLPAPWFMCAL